MATSSSYYLNAPSLGSATAVFTDDTLLILAADGFYSDGVISREQVSGVLLPQQTCPSCLSYNCVEGVCTDPGDGSGLYATLEECELACSPPAVSYNCVLGTCTDPGDGSGTYATLIDCEAACGPPVYSYTVRLDNSTGTICSAPIVTVWSTSVLLTTGDVIYYFSDLTGLVTGYNYVVRTTGSPNIYDLNPATAVIGLDTTLTC